MDANIGESDFLSIGQSYTGFQQTPEVGKKSDIPRTFWARVKEALEDTKRLPVTQKFAAKLANVKQPSVSDWNKPGKGPELDNALRLAKTLNVCVEWLYTERGPKRPGRPEDAYAQRLWDLWPRLSDTVRGELVGYAAVKAAPLDPPNSDLQKAS